MRLRLGEIIDAVVLYDKRGIPDKDLVEAIELLFDNLSDPKSVFQVEKYVKIYADAERADF